MACTRGVVSEKVDDTLLHAAVRADLTPLKIEGALCRVCGTTISSSFALCPGCDSPSHRDCWEYNHGCSIYGCEYADRGSEEPTKPRATDLVVCRPSKCFSESSELSLSYRMPSSGAPAKPANITVKATGMPNSAHHMLVWLEHFVSNGLLAPVVGALFFARGAVFLMDAVVTTSEAGGHTAPGICLIIVGVLITRSGWTRLHDS